MISSHEAAKALLAMEPFMLAKIPTPSKKPVAGDSAPKKAKYKGKPDSEFALRLHALYGRKPETLWTVEEVELFLQIKPSYDPAEMTMLEQYYAAEKKKGRGQHGGIWRSALDTLLRNWNTEMDRARAYHDAKQRRAVRFEPKPEKVVPFADPADEERLRREGAEAMAALKKAL